MFPARPAPPRLSALTNPPFTMLTDLPALKDTLPPLPTPCVVVDMELPAPVVGDRPETEIVSVAVKVTVPALPEPSSNWPVSGSGKPLRLRISAPLCTVNEPTFPKTSPAFPSQPVDELTRAPSLKVNCGAV